MRRRCVPSSVLHDRVSSLTPFLRGPHAALTLTFVLFAFCVTPSFAQALHEVRNLIVDAGLNELESTLLLRRLGCLGVQLHRHSYQAYNPVVQKIQAVYDLILHGALQPLETVPIHSLPREPGTYKSGLMRLSEEYDDLLDEVGCELYW